MANIDKFKVGDIVTQENSDTYNVIIGIGKTGARAVDRYLKLTREWYDTIIIRRNNTSYELYDPRPELSQFFNVYDTGGTGVAYESLERARGGIPNYQDASDRCVGTLEVVRKEEELIRTVWHDREKK